MVAPGVEIMSCGTCLDFYKKLARPDASERAQVRFGQVSGSIILAIGMAVDSNVLIFERIREEIRAKKSIRAAIDAGYDKAFWTVVDSHVTTLITAVALYEFGSGPVKGFAVTLIVGILASMFTAITITRAIFDYVLDRWRPRSLSIGMIDPTMKMCQRAHHPLPNRNVTRFTRGS